MSLPNRDLQDALRYLDENAYGSQSAWEMFQFLRKEIQHEHSLLSGRVSWLITSQSFLLTIFAVMTEKNQTWTWFPNLLLPILAILIALMAMAMIFAATSTIASWAEQRKQLMASYPMLDPLLIRRWRSGLTDIDWLHERSIWFPQLMPVLFILVWLAILFFSKPMPFCFYL